MPISTEWFFIRADRAARHLGIADKDLISFYDQFREKSIDEVAFSDLSDAEKAEDMAYEVLERLEREGYSDLDLDDLEDFYTKAKMALQLDANCLPAYELVIKVAEYYAVRERHILKGVAVGEQKFGGKFEEKNTGKFWGITPTRPFMRLLAAKASVLQSAGKRNEAVDIYRRLLKMHPDDAIGVRNILQCLLLELKDFDGFMDLIDQFPDDESIHSLYNYALYLYMIEGDTQEANEALIEAIEYNPFVMAYLRGKKKLNFDPITTYQPRFESGANFYCIDALDIWRKQYKIQDWLKQFQ